METSEAAAAHRQKYSVKVAVNIRPLITVELHDGCTDCVTVTPGEPQVQIGPHVFTFEHVYGSSGPSSSLIFEQYVHPLIDALFSVDTMPTVLAYGQIFKEDVFDLLDANQNAVRLDAGSMAKASAPGRVPIQIRETATGGITLAGVTEAEVKSKEEMASYLTRRGFRSTERLSPIVSVLSSLILVKIVVHKYNVKHDFYLKYIWMF